MGKFVRNAWYPAAWTRDIKNELTQRQVIGERVCLWRGQDGKAHALDDCCPHRMLPLSMGKLRGDTVECGYHGMTFDCSGTCVRIPGQAMIPERANVRGYPVHEKLGLVWIWMGDPKRADVKDIYDLPAYDDKDYSILEGDALAIGCNYLNLADNLCDPAHVSFVHLSTLGGASGEEIPIHTDVLGPRKMVTWRWTLDAPPVGLMAMTGKFKGNVDRWQYYYYDAPSTSVIDFGSQEANTGAPDGRRNDCQQMWSCHFLSPVDEHNCIDYWLVAKNFAHDKGSTDKLREGMRLAFNEDKVVLEAIEMNEIERPGQRPVRLGIDLGVGRMRKMVDDLLAQDGPA